MRGLDAQVQVKNPAGNMSDVFDVIGRNGKADVSALLWDKAKP